MYGDFQACPQLYSAQAPINSVYKHIHFLFHGDWVRQHTVRGCAQHVLIYVVILLFQKNPIFFAKGNYYNITKKIGIFYFSSRNSVFNFFSSSFVSVYDSFSAFLCLNLINSSVNNFCAIT